MKGYPKRIACKQDFINLLKEEEFKDLALSDLRAVLDMPDETMLTTTTRINPDDPESDWNTEEVENPNPKWKQLGFDSRQAVADLITENGGNV